MFMYIINQFQTTLAHWGRGVKSGSKGDYEWQGGKLVTLSSQLRPRIRPQEMGQQWQGDSVESSANLESKFV
jgi:hypothetical protein